MKRALQKAYKKLLSNYEPNATDFTTFTCKREFSIQQTVQNMMREFCSTVLFSNSKLSEKTFALVKNEYNIYELPEQSTNVLNVKM